MSTKSRTARLSIFSNTALIVMNTVVGLMSGSVSILSVAAHSIIDLMAALMAYFSINIPDKHVDERHALVDGKFKNVSGLVEALIILAASAWIIYLAIFRLIAGEQIIGDVGLTVGFIVMMVSALINLVVSRHLYKVAKETDSIALKTDALHLSTHVYTSAGVGISLAVIYFTGWHFLDPISAIVVASFILKEAFEILIEAYKPLIDNSLPEDELLLINEVIKHNISKPMGYRKLITRKTGSKREIDFHLEVPGDMHVDDAHSLCGRIEEELKENLANLKVTVHVEPFGHHLRNSEF